MFGTFPATNVAPSPAPEAAPAEPVKNDVSETAQADQQSAVEEVAETVRTEEATDTDNSGDTDSQSSEDSESETESAKKPKRGFERRIEKFNAKLAAKENELNYWRDMALKANGQQPEAQPAPQNTDKPKFSDYNDIEAYTEAVTEWKVSRALQQVQQQSQVQQLTQTYEQRLVEYKKSVPDFDAVMTEFVEDYGDMNVPEIVQVAMESQVGPQLAYYLASNVEEVERIAKLPSHRRLLELGKLEDRLAKPVAVETQPEPPPAKKVTSAPPPVKPVRGTGKVESNDLSDPNLSYSEWVKRREASLRRA